MLLEVSTLLPPFLRSPALKDRAHLYSQSRCTASIVRPLAGGFTGAPLPVSTRCLHAFISSLVIFISLIIISAFIIDIANIIISWSNYLFE